MHSIVPHGCQNLNNDMLSMISLFACVYLFPIVDYFWGKNPRDLSPVGKNTRILLSVLFYCFPVRHPIAPDAYVFFLVSPIHKAL